jgi:acetyl-CoA C-acetyltransferase
MNSEKVAIIGYALTNYVDKCEVRSDELIFKAAGEAIQKARIRREDIDFVVVATADAYDGITISNGLLAPAAGAYNRDSIRLENGGGSALGSACAAILGGAAEIVMVSSADAVTSDPIQISNKSYDPFFLRPIGMNYIISSAMIATKYMHRYHVTEYDYALMAAQDHSAAANNKFAHVKTEYSVEQILASPVISWPLHQHEICPVSSYGAAAIILASEEKAKSLCDRPIWITGFGMGSERYFNNWNHVAKLPGLVHAAQKAYKMAGIRNPRKQIQAVETCGFVAPLDLMQIEALGFCDQGEGKDLLRHGVLSPTGDLPVNFSGGALCTNGLNSGGLFRTIQGVMYLRGELSISKDNAHRAIVCDSDANLGFPGGSYAVLILEKGANHA